AVGLEELLGASVALVDDACDLGVDAPGHLLAQRLGRRGRRAASEVGVVARRQREGPDAGAHAPARDHYPGQLGDLLEVVLGAGRAVPVDERLGRAPAERSDAAGPAV